MNIKKPKITKFKHAFNAKVNFANIAQQNFYIRTKNNNLDLIKFNREQKEINKLVADQYKNFNYNKILVLKSRQIGSTTFFCAYGFYKVLLNKAFKAFVLSHRQSSTNNLYDIVLRFYNNLPDHYKQKTLSTRNKSMQFLESDSFYNFATAGSKEVARGETIQFFHGSEVAFWPNAQNHIAAILSAIPQQNSYIFLESTSSGPSGVFYDMCMDAIANKNNYKLIFLPWFWHEGYEINNFDQELPKAWLEYKQTYNLSTSQTAWAYNQNKLISLNNGDNGPSDLFIKEFPASVEEAFKFSNNNNLINVSSMKNCLLTSNFNNLINTKNLLSMFLEQQKTSPVILGIDMAYGGEDSCYIIDRTGSFIGFNVNVKIQSKDTMQIVGLVKQYVEKFRCKDIFIDVAGGGVGVCDRLAELGIFANKIHFAASSSNKEKFANIRAHMWYKIKEFFDEGGYIINDNWILHQLSNVPYFYNSHGQIQLQSKDEIKKILKYSPDAGDAIALTFAKEILAQHKIITSTNNNSNYYNPLNY